ncbi:MAG: hypothetical protein KJ063_10210 [Anaerolineae bacterium]|nr:hypothetical protein [Anaerolineae bacterium]
MRKKLTREERKIAYLKEAEQLYDNMETWYDQNPDATFEEIETELRLHRRQLMGKSLNILINDREDDQQPQISCPDCGTAMRFKGRGTKTVIGIEGDTTLDRTYYSCPNKCEGTAFFPSG